VCVCARLFLRHRYRVGSLGKKTVVQPASLTQQILRAGERERGGGREGERAPNCGSNVSVCVCFCICRILRLFPPLSLSLSRPFSPSLRCFSDGAAPKKIPFPVLFLVVNDIVSVNGDRRRHRPAAVTGRRLCLLLLTVILMRRKCRRKKNKQPTADC
jgi:hypothetical protein